MKNIYCLLLLILSGTIFSQVTNINDVLQEIDELKEGKTTEEIYHTFKNIYPTLNPNDSNRVALMTMNYFFPAIELEETHRLNMNFEKSLEYGLESLDIIKDKKGYFEPGFAEFEPVLIKDIVVSYMGLNEFEKAKEYKSLLYEKYKKEDLPEGIDQFFNFDYFKLGDKNIWGYEWFVELPKNRFSTSFTKNVYYVYSTNEDGTDKEQLYRFHVLMFHQDPVDPRYDYILERQKEENGQTVYGSYFRYRYKEAIDYQKLRNDVIEIVTKGIEPDTRRTIQLQ